VDKSDSPDPVATNGALTYTIKVSNFGPDTATNVVVTDKLAGGLGYVSATSTAGKCSLKGNKVTCAVGDLAADATDPYAAGSQATITLKVTAPKKAGTITNTASAAADTTDPNPANDSDTEKTRVVEAPSQPKCGGATATIVGTSSGETLVGTPGRDVIVAGGGDDTVKGLAGADIVCAGAGADVVRSGGGNDRAFGGGGRDILSGQGGADQIRGQGRGDRLRGGRGKDLLVGGRGHDRCAGGPGRDRTRSCED
jgi:uncharacterized repeat protein (TIGR01451 family)